MKVLWGGNDFTDCVALLQWGDHSLLRVSTAPIRVDLNIPKGLASSELRIEHNRLTVPGSSRVSVSERPEAVSVSLGKVLILMAQATDNDTIVLHADLRSVGLNIFDDVAGLHVGGTIMADSSFRGCSAAIVLS